MTSILQNNVHYLKPVREYYPPLVANAYTVLLVFSTASYGYMKNHVSYTVQQYQRGTICWIFGVGRVTRRSLPGLGCTVVVMIHVYNRSGPFKAPVCASQKYRHYSGNRPYPAYCH